ncbi:S8 family serine peptidase [Sulfurimonas sp.]|nr:S8 family serine peptidase [Sulfurimonas sp.]
MRIGSIHAMSMSVNTSMNVNNNAMSTALGRLSSGLRINSAADDASAMTIANSLTSQAHGIQQEVSNRNDEIGLLQIADKAIDEQTNIMQTIRTKIVQMSNDTQNSESRRAIRQDVYKLLQSYQSIVDNTSYNGMKLLSGSYSSRHNLDIADTSVSKLGHVSMSESNTVVNSGKTQLSLTNFGKTTTFKSVEIGHEKGTGLGALANEINSRSSETGVHASYVVKSMSKSSIEAGEVDMAINGVDIGKIIVEDNDSGGLLVSAINKKSTQTGVTARVDVSGHLVLDSSDGRGIVINKSNSSSSGSITFTATNTDAVADTTRWYGISTTLGANDTFAFTYNGSTETATLAGTDIAAVNAAIDAEIGADKVTATLTDGNGIIFTSDDASIKLSGGDYTDDSASTTLAAGNDEADAAFTTFGGAVENLTKGDTVTFSYDGTDYTATIGYTEDSQADIYELNRAIDLAVDTAGNVLGEGKIAATFVNYNKDLKLRSDDAYKTLTGTSYTDVDGTSKTGTSATGLDIIKENYGKITLTQSGSAEVQINASGVLDGSFSTQKAATFNYFKNEQLNTYQSLSTRSTTPLNVSSDLISDYLELSSSNSTNVTAARSRYGIDGSNSTVVVIDSGIIAEHSFFDGRVVEELDFTGNDNPDDKIGVGDVGHGTHVASIIGSSDETYTGVAPGVDIISLKVFPNTGETSSNANAISDALEWVAANADKYNITAVNMSLGTTEDVGGGDYKATNSNTPQTLWDSQLSTLANMGIINVAAAGNDYEHWQAQGAAQPANSIYSIGVGSVVLNSGADPLNSISTFSQRSTDVLDVFAYGEYIWAADSHDVDGAVQLPGTSMASPEVAGIVTLVQELAEKEWGRSLTLEEMRTLLVNTSTKIYDGDDEPTVDGNGDAMTPTNEDYYRIDALGAMDAIVAISKAVSPDEITTGLANDTTNNVDERLEFNLLMHITDSAMTELDTIRSGIGSTQNKLISDINYKSIQTVNLMNSASQLQDADFALESAQLQKSLILVQASSFAFSQITQRYDMIERLLA